MLSLLLYVHLSQFPEARETLLPYDYVPTLALSIFVPPSLSWSLSHVWAKLNVGVLSRNRLSALSYSEHLASQGLLCIAPTL